jgi:hypothetical protein
MSDHALLLFWDLQGRKLRRVGTALLVLALIGLLLGPPEPAAELVPYEVILALLAWDAWILHKISGGRMLMELGVHQVGEPAFLHRFVALKALRLAGIVWPLALVLWWLNDEARVLATALIPVGYAAGLYWLFTAYGRSWPKKLGLLLLALFVGCFGATLGHMADVEPPTRKVTGHLFALAVFACWGPASLAAALDPRGAPSPTERKSRRRSSENPLVFRWGHTFPAAWLAAGGYLALLLTTPKFEPCLLWSNTALFVLGYALLVSERERRQGTWELLVATGLRQTEFLTGWRQHVRTRIAALLLGPALTACWLGYNPLLCSVLLCALYLALLEASTLLWMARQDPHCLRCVSLLGVIPAAGIVLGWFPVNPFLLQSGMLVVGALALLLARRYAQARCFSKRDWLRPFLTKEPFL